MVIGSKLLSLIQTCISLYRGVTDLCAAMFESFDNEDLRAEIHYRRLHVHKYTEEILCQQPRIMYVSHRIYIQWAMHYMNKLLRCDSECILANILVYARPTSISRFSVSFNRKPAILRTDIGHPCYDASITAPGKEREREELRDAMRHHLSMEVSFSIQRRLILEIEDSKLNKLRNCRVSLPLPNTWVAF